MSSGSEGRGGTAWARARGGGLGVAMMGGGADGACRSIRRFAAACGGVCVRRVTGAWLVAASLGLGFAGGVPAQECSAADRVGWLGITGLACNCTLTTGDVPEWSFRSEPRITAVERGSPAAGVLQPGDDIVAVGGDPITTSGAGRVFGGPDPGRPLRLTVRREGRLEEVEIVPAALCRGDDRLASVPAAPRGLPRVPRQPAPPVDAPPPPPLSRVRAPEAPAPLAQPSPDAGWFGFGIRCGRCGWERGDGPERSTWFFEENPSLMFVEEGSPAARAGLREGDELVAIDGVPLLTGEGGRRFGAVDPGQTVAWTYRRAGAEATVSVTATERPLDPGMARIATMLDSLSARIRRGERVPPDFLRQFQPVAAPNPPADRRRYRDTIGNVEVDVSGGPSIVTTIVEPGRDLIIDTGNARIRVRTTDARRE